jgi:hypothetical protein
MTQPLMQSGPDDDETAQDEPAKAPDAGSQDNDDVSEAPPD